MSRPYPNNLQQESKSWFTKMASAQIYYAARELFSPTASVRAEAESWFDRYKDTSNPQSLANCCLVLGLDAEAVSIRALRIARDGRRAK